MSTAIAPTVQDIRPGRRRLPATRRRPAGRHHPLRRGRAPVSASRLDTVYRCLPEQTVWPEEDHEQQYGVDHGGAALARDVTGRKLFDNADDDATDDRPPNARQA